MKIIQVSDVYNVTQISKNNNEAWEKLISAVEEVPEEEEVTLDFKDISIEDPWTNEAFKKLVGIERVYFRVYSSEKFKDTFDIACELGILKKGRAINIDEIVEIPPPPKNMVLEGLINRLYEAIEISDGIGMLNVYDVVTQISSFDTVKAIEEAIERYNKDTGISKFAVGTEYMFIQVNIIELLAKVIGRLKSKGITFILLSKDKDVESKIRIYQCTEANRNKKPLDRAKIIQGSVEPYTAGMLSKFKTTKKLDEFGRMGEGKPIMCRVAIFKKIDKELNVHFDLYHGDYFYTKMHYQLDNDGAELDSLQVEGIKIPITKLGFCNEFTGAEYHFNLPIQGRLEDYFHTYVEDTDGEIIETEVTLPERIQMVFRDFGVRFNEAALIKAIADTRDYLEQLKKNIAESEEV